MIINKTIKIKVNPNSRKYYNTLGYDCQNFDIIDINTIDLPKGSNIKINIKCDNCLLEQSVIYNKYYKSTDSLTNQYFCKKCNYIKCKKTKLEKYGNENFINIEKIKETKLKKYGNSTYNNIEKIKETNLEKYGKINISSVSKIKEKKKNTFINKYGVENPFQSEEIKEKIKNTNLEKWGSEHYISSNDANIKYKLFCNKLGVDHYSKTNEFKLKFEDTCIKKWGEKTCLLNNNVRNKILNTNILKYGFNSHMKNKDIVLIKTKKYVENRQNYFDGVGYNYIDYDLTNQTYKLQKKECGHIFNITYDLFRSRIKYNNNSCIICYPKNSLSSIKEKEVLDWLKELNIKVIENNRTLIKKEIDIYLPEFKIGIEFNGLYYHSDKFKDKYYHINKTNMCNDIGIELIHIWEDDWIYKKEIVKSIILNKLKLIKNKIFARKCEIREVDYKQANIFLKSNHIQGYTTSTIKIGLFYNNELVSIMTFGNRRINKSNNMELIRFCNKINFNIIGAASKLFKYFNKKYTYENIVSYSDLSLFKGEIYNSLGFKNNGNTSLNYYWTDLNTKYHRFTFNKKKLVKMGHDENLTEEEIMKNIGFYKIWSCGQIRWIYNKI